MEKTLFKKVGEVKGKVSEKEESFSFQFTPQNENLKATRGSLFTLVTIESDEKEKSEKAKSFYHAFQSSYYAKVSGSIVSSLSDTIDQINTDIIKKEAQAGTNISIIAAVFWNSILYLAKVGNNGVFVARGGKTKRLEVAKVVSGVLEDKDSVCLASARFLEAVTEEELGEYLKEEKFEKTLERIDDKIAGIEGAVCILIRLSINEPEKTPAFLTVGEVDEKGEVKFPEEAENEDGLEANKESEEQEKTTSLEAEENNLTSRSNYWMLFQEKAGQLLNKITFLLAKIGKKIFKNLAKPWRKAEPGEHIDHVAVRKQRIGQIVIALIVLLGLSIGFGIVSKGNTAKKEKIGQLFSLADNNLQKAANLKNIDPSQAKNLVEKAKLSAKEAEKLGGDRKKIADIESKAASLIAEITRSYQVDSLETVFDFTTVSSNAKITRLAGNSKIILATDKASSNVYKYNLDTGAVTKLVGDLQEAENIASFDSGFYLQVKNGVIRFDKNGENPVSVANNSGWGKIVGAATFQNYLYLLDKDKVEVWRYVATTKGLSNAKAYLAADKPNLSSASAIAIDTLVWIATENGKIYKFSQGKHQEFNLTNLSDSFEKVVDFYTSSETKNHYILDQGKGRVVIVSKDGVYQAQYNHQQLHQASSILVNESNKTVYFAAGGKLYRFQFN